jgi:hypothetical protein
MLLAISQSVCAHLRRSAHSGAARDVAILLPILGSGVGCKEIDSAGASAWYIGPQVSTRDERIAASVQKYGLDYDAES